MPDEAPSESIGFPADEMPSLPPEETPPSPAAPAAAEAAPEPQTEPPKRYVVAPGHGVTVRRGTLGEGTAIRATDLSAEQLAAFEASGHLVAR